VRVTKAGSSGYTISLATSFHRETSERPFTVTGTRDGGGGTGVIYLVTDMHRLQEPAAWSAPIRGLGLSLEDTQLASVLAEFERELDRVGIMRLRPRYYLSTEWGVPTGSIAIAIPFYLARPDLTAMQREQNGYVEGVGRADILRYLRHEMGHVMNYAYRLYDDPEWVERFGAITQPYEEEYRPEPFSRRFVVHLPGWYAQKHPDEDWSETFAVWMTPWPRLAYGIRRLARGAREARVLRPHHRAGARPATARHVGASRRGRGRPGLLGAGMVRRA
jgi:hypothetical protein